MKIYLEVSENPFNFARRNIKQGGTRVVQGKTFKKNMNMNDKTTTEATPSCTPPTRAGGKRQECVRLWEELTREYPGARAADKVRSIALHLKISPSGVRDNLTRSGIVSTDAPVNLVCHGTH